MVISPRSRGKGNRRYPPPHRRAKRRRIYWRERAVQLVATQEELLKPLSTLLYKINSRGSVAHAMYMFDQEMIRLQVKFFASFVRGRWYDPAHFTVVVSEEDAKAVADAISRIEGA